MTDRRWGRIGLATAVASIGLPWLATTGGAQPDGGPELTLVDHTFSVPIDGRLSLSYDVDGPLPPGVLPTTTTSPSTTTTTTPEAPGDREAGADDATPSASAPTTPPTTTTVPDVDGEVRVLVYPQLTDPSQVAPILAGDTSGVGDADDGLDVELDDALSVSGRGQNRSVELDVEIPVADRVTDSPDVGMPEPGIYPVETLLRLDGETVARHMTLVRREPDDATTTFNLGVLAAAFDDDTVADDLARLTALGELDAPVMVAIPPDLLADVNRTDPDLVADLATALDDDEAVALPQDTLDASSAANAGLDDLFTRHLRTGEDILTDLLPQTPVRRSVWPIVDEPPSVGGANLLAQLGVRTFAVSSPVAAAYVEPVDPSGLSIGGDEVRVPLPDGDTDATLVDPSVAALLEDAGSRPPRDVAMELLSALTIRHGLDPRVSTLLTTSNLGIADPDVIEALIEVTDSTDDIAFTAVSALPSGSSIGDSQLVLPSTAGVDLQPRVDAVNLARLQLDDAVSMLPDDDPRRIGWQEELDELLTTNITETDADQAITGLLAEADALRRAVVAPEPFTFTMTGRESDVSVRIANNTDTALTVRVVPTSPKLTFPDGSHLVELEPNTTTLIPIAVVARSNGTSELVVSITTPNGERITEPVHLTASVRSLTGLSQLVTGGAALVLLTWWITHLRRRRQQRRLAVEAARHPSNLTRSSPDAAEAATNG